MVNHATDFVYSHLITGTSVEETLAAKGSYEQVMNKYGHRVKSYHGDNSHFDSTELKHIATKLISHIHTVALEHITKTVLPKPRTKSLVMMEERSSSMLKGNGRM
eukprot:13404073-Ditylum_brightwellii.AAC.1